MKKRDSEVEQQVLRTLKLNSAIGGSELCVESQAGLVTLSGTTTSPHDRQAVYEATRDIPGVRGVVNKIEVETYRFFTPEKSLSASASAPVIQTLMLVNSMPR